MGGDEAALQVCGRGAVQGVPAQSEALFRRSVLPYKDIAKLADVLGHSSIETTRIYLLTSGAEHQRQLDRLGLVS